MSNNSKIEAPYGSWSSPITADLIVIDSVRIGEAEGLGNSIIFSEIRASEKGRSTIVAFEKGKLQDLIPPEYNVRTTVHEYGGKSFLVNDKSIYFSNYSDQQLYIRKPSGEITKLTSEKDARFADGCVFKNFLIYVMETHGKKVENCLVLIDKQGNVKRIAEGWDFYREPRISPNGKMLAYYRWNHPNMPWDGGELVVADLDEEGNLINEHTVAGGPEESISQLAWGPDGMLYYTSDRGNWWNIYREGQNLCPMEAEIGFPQWVFGQSYFDFWKSSIVFVVSENGKDSLKMLHEGKLENIDLPFETIQNPKVTHDSIIFLGSSPNTPPSLIQLNLKTKKWETIKASRNMPIPDEDISEPEAIEFPTDNGKIAYAFYYAPKNTQYVGPKPEKPPLLVLSHGGPTAHVTPNFNLRIQYWTNRGFAVIDVNYGGSSGYGREYRNRLNGKWGIVDVADCTNAALYCASKGWVDRERISISGGSAGGYTTLACLAFTDVFKAGACYYGVSDLEALANDTHKFESRYLDKLVGAYPKEKQLYIERSPIHHVDKIKCPIIILQGNEDKIVPPSQSEMMYESLLKRGIPTAYLLFEKEQHGFRQAENIKRALESQIYFFSKIFKFELADDIEPLTIGNL